MSTILYNNRWTSNQQTVASKHLVANFASEKRCSILKASSTSSIEKESVNEEKKGLSLTVSRRSAMTCAMSLVSRVFGITGVELAVLKQGLQGQGVPGLFEPNEQVVQQSESFGLKASKLLGDRNNIAFSAAGNMAEASTGATQENALEWVKKDKRRMLHVVYRVGDLDRTIKFYTECLGMKLLRKRDIPEERYTNAFLGYGPEDSHFVIELTYNYGVDKYDIGAGFGHFGIAVEDVTKTVDLIKAKGGKVTREPGPVKGGKTVIAFIEDPDGYKFELLERGPTPEPLCQVMLRVGDLERAINFYEKAYGMELLRTRDNPEYKYSIAMMGYGPEDKNAVMELTYNYGVTEYDKGNAYAQIAIGTDDVYKTAEAIRLSGGKITREPGPLPGINTKITACLDPDGWKTVFVDNIDFLKELE